MSKQAAKPQSGDNWLQWAIVVLTAGAVSTGAAYLVLERQASRTAPGKSAAQWQPVGAGSAGAPSTADNAAPANAPATLTAGMTPAQAAVTLGNWNYDHENWTQAIVHYREAITRGLDNPDMRTDLGNCFRFLGRPQEALDQYKQAQRQNPQHEHSLFNQGGLYAFILKQPAQGIAVWREYLKRFPQGRNVAEARKLLDAAHKGAAVAPKGAAVAPKGAAVAPKGAAVAPKSGL